MGRKGQRRYHFRRRNRQITRTSAPASSGLTAARAASASVRRPHPISAISRAGHAPSTLWHRWRGPRPRRLSRAAAGMAHENQGRWNSAEGAGKALENQGRWSSAGKALGSAGPPSALFQRPQRFSSAFAPLLTTASRRPTFLTPLSETFHAPV